MVQYQRSCYFATNLSEITACDFTSVKQDQQLARLYFTFFISCNTSRLIKYLSSLDRGHHGGEVVSAVVSHAVRQEECGNCEWGSSCVEFECSCGVWWLSAYECSNWLQDKWPGFLTDGCLEGKLISILSSYLLTTVFICHYTSASVWLHTHCWIC